MKKSQFLHWLIYLSPIPLLILFLLLLPAPEPSPADQGVTIILEPFEPEPLPAVTADSKVSEPPTTEPSPNRRTTPPQQSRLTSDWLNKVINESETSNDSFE